MKKSASRPASKSKRVLIVDDHPMMRDGLRQLLSSEAGIEVCGEADDGPAAVALAEKLLPDAAIVDLTLRTGSGLDLIKDLHLRSPSTAVLVLSMHDEALYAERVLKAGGRGYIMKQEGGKKIVEALRTILEGRIAVSDSVSHRILSSFSGQASSASPQITEQLSDREFEIYRLIGEGHLTKDIADKLHISPKTVEVHRVNIKKKLGISSFPELIRHAVRWVETNPGK